MNKRTPRLVLSVLAMSLVAASSAMAESYSYTDSGASKPNTYSITTAGDKLNVEFCPSQGKGNCMKGSVKKTELQSKLKKDADELKSLLSKDLSAEIVKASKATDAQVITDAASKKELILIRQGSLNVYIPKEQALKGDTTIVKGAIESSLSQMDAALSILSSKLPATFKTDDYQKISAIHYLTLAAIQASQSTQPVVPTTSAKKQK